MPIPQYEPTEKPAPLPGVMAQPNAPLAAFGGGEAASQATNQAGGLAQDAARELFRKAAEEKAKASDALVSEKRTQLVEMRDDILHNPETGILFKEGKNAFGALAPALERYKKGAADLENSLVTPEQKAHFRMYANAHEAELYGAVQTHVGAQTKAYYQNTYASESQASANSAASNALTDPKMVQANILLQQQANIKLAGLKGLSLESTKEFLETQETHTHGLVIGAMLDAGQDQAAKQYYDANKDRLVGLEANQIAARVRAQSTLGDAYRIADVVMSYEPDTMQDGLTHLDRLAEQDKLDPKVREEAQRLIENRWRAQAHAQAAAKDKVFEGMAENLRKTGDLESLQKSSQWSEIPERDKEHLELMASRLSKGVTPYAERNDPRTVADFYALSKEQLAQMEKGDLLRKAPYVKEGEFIDMTKHWNAARQKEDDAAFKFTEHEERYVFDKVKRAGLADLSRLDKMDGLSRDKAESYGEIRDEVKDALKAYVHENKKNANQEEREKIINDIVTDKAISEKYAYGAMNRLVDTVTGGLTGYLSSHYNIPAGVRKAINDDVKALTGKDATGHQMMILWHAKKLGASKDELRKLALQE